MRYLIPVFCLLLAACTTHTAKNDADTVTPDGNTPMMNDAKIHSNTLKAVSEQKFPPENIQDLVGKFTDTFTKSSFSFRVPMLQNLKYAIQIRDAVSREFILVAEVVPDGARNRDKVACVIELPPQKHDREFVELNCYNKKKPNRDVDVIFGIIDQSILKKTYVPSHAWRIDLTSRTFQELPANKIECKPESAAGFNETPGIPDSSY